MPFSAATGACDAAPAPLAHPTSMQAIAKRRKSGGGGIAREVYARQRNRRAATVTAHGIIHSRPPLAGLPVRCLVPHV
jgi:hypothetical protein